MTRIILFVSVVLLTGGPLLVAAHLLRCLLHLLGNAGALAPLRRLLKGLGR